jgi:hypothetical protein
MSILVKKRSPLWKLAGGRRDGEEYTRRGCKGCSTKEEENKKLKDNRERKEVEFATRLTRVLRPEGGHGVREQDALFDDPGEG